MICLIIVFFALVPISFGQLGVSGSSTTSGICSPAVSGNQNTFTIRCSGISKQQYEQFLKILNKIAQDQLPADKVMQKLDELQQAIVKINDTRFVGHEYTNTDITAQGGGIGVRISGPAPVKFDHDHIVAGGGRDNGHPSVGVDDNSGGQTTLSNITTEARAVSRTSSGFVVEGAGSTYHGDAGFILHMQPVPECGIYTCTDLIMPISTMTLAEAKGYGIYLTDMIEGFRSRCSEVQLNHLYRSMILQYDGVQERIQSLLPNTPSYGCLQLSAPPQCSFVDASRQMRSLIDSLPR